MNTRTIYVRYMTGTYQTATVNGKRASCTHSAQAAAENLGRKLYGEKFLRAELIPGEQVPGTEQWRLWTQGAA